MSKLIVTPWLVVATAAASAAPLQDKTLVVWAQPATLEQAGGKRAHIG